jgi:hypothetical protein
MRNRLKSQIQFPYQIPACVPDLYFACAHLHCIFTDRTPPVRARNIMMLFQKTPYAMRRDYLPFISKVQVQSFRIARAEVVSIIAFFVQLIVGVRRASGHQDFDPFARNVYHLEQYLSFCPSPSAPARRRETRYTFCSEPFFPFFQDSSVIFYPMHLAS